MKHTKRTLSLVLALVMLVPVMALPVAAYTTIPTQWLNYISSFPQVTRYNNFSGKSVYVLALQRYLMCFDTTSRDKLYSNGHYMDGDFGARTEDAVIYCQGELDVKPDGYVGPNTWSVIANSMRYYTENYGRVKRPAGINGWVFLIGVDGDGVLELYFFLADGETPHVI